MITKAFCTYFIGGGRLADAAIEARGIKPGRRTAEAAKLLDCQLPV